MYVNLCKYHELRSNVKKTCTFTTRAISFSRIMTQISMGKNSISMGDDFLQIHQIDRQLLKPLVHDCCVDLKNCVLHVFIVVHRLIF